jgi:hypothetical protein
LLCWAGSLLLLLQIHLQLLNTLLWLPVVAGEVTVAVVVLVALDQHLGFL